PAYFTYYNEVRRAKLPQELAAYKTIRDSLNDLKYRLAAATVTSPDAVEKRAPKAEIKNDSSTQAQQQLTKPKVKPKPKAKPVPKKDVVKKIPKKVVPPKKKDEVKKEVKKLELPISDSLRLVNDSIRIAEDSIRVARLDSIFYANPDKKTLENAANQARQVKTQILNSNASMDSYVKEWITFNIQWHKILANSMACIAMFLIGAPLGAIIKKGGLGMPFLVSILFFIIYYVLTMQGETLAKQETVSVAFGVWMADAILFMVGLVFLRQARLDARLFEADFYSVVFDKFKRWFAARKTIKTPG